MKKLISGLFVLATATAAFAQAPAGQPAGARPPAGPGLTLASASFEDGGIIPNKYTQADPKPTSPDLKITNVPAGTQTFVLLFHDPDVAIQKKIGDVTHGLWFNIPGTTTGFAEGDLTAPKVPEGTVQAKNLRGQPGYMGPGAGAAGPYHHYTFELFALDTKLELGADATRDQVMAAMDGHIVGKAVLMGRFHR